MRVNRFYLHLSEYVWINELYEFVINSTELIGEYGCNFDYNGKQFYLYSLKGFRRFRLLRKNNNALVYQSEDNIICRILI